MKLCTRRSKPHNSEIPPKNYPEFLSMEEGIRIGESVRQTILKYYPTIGQ